MARGKKGKKSKLKKAAEKLDPIQDKIIAKMDSSKAIEAASFAGLTYMYKEGVLDLIGPFIQFITGEKSIADLHIKMGAAVELAAIDRYKLEQKVRENELEARAIQIRTQAWYLEGQGLDTSHLEKQLLDLAKEILKEQGKPIPSDEDIKKIPTVQAKIELGKWLAAMGMAGATIHLLKSYEVSELVEHLPLQ
jgi:hypothetical protein